MANYYQGDLTWADLTQTVSIMSENLRATLRKSEEDYNEWITFRASRSDAVIATALSRAESDIADMDSAFSAGHAMYDYANNVAPTQSDYNFSLRKFGR